jgi:hypothetical protein
VILTYVVNEKVLRRFDLPARATPQFYRGTSIKARKSSFELIQRFAVPTCGELIAYRSGDTILIKEDNLLTGISYKSSILGDWMAGRGA